LGPEGQRCRLAPTRAPWLAMVAQVRARVSLARRVPARSLTLTSLSSVPLYVSSGPRGGWLAMAAQLSRSKPHILAVAPSNVAVDNMIQRIMDKGFHDGGGGRYNPSILRLGAGSKVTEHTRTAIVVRCCHSPPAPSYIATVSISRPHSFLCLPLMWYNVLPFQVKTVTLEDTLDAEQAAFRALSGDDRGAHTRRLEGQLDALLTEVGLGGGLLCISVLFSPHLAPSLTPLFVSARLPKLCPTPVPAGLCGRCTRCRRTCWCCARPSENTRCPRAGR
jgi:AAA domain